MNTVLPPQTYKHEYDEDGCCIHCGFDGAEWYWWKTSTYEGRALAGEECEPKEFKNLFAKLGADKTGEGS